MLLKFANKYFVGKKKYICVHCTIAGAPPHLNVSIIYILMIRMTIDSTGRLHYTFSSCYERKIKCK